MPPRPAMPAAPRRAPGRIREARIWETLSSSEFELVDCDANVTPKSADRTTRVSAGRASLIGTVVGNYRLRTLIGEGGMSEVYEAQHVALGKIVAIKMLKRERAGDSRAVTRLAQEARIVASLNHPNICEVYDIGSLPDGRSYTVMDRLHGETLGDRIRRDGAVAAGDIVPMVVQLLSALAAVHKLGIIHCDLKPQNVFLAPRMGATPRVKLLDFGMSRSVTGDATRIARVGSIAGTPVYMAPEQISDSKQLDGRVDVWGTGVILYEALSGRPPFWSANFPALVHQITRSRHRPLYDVDPSIPLELVAIVDRALAKNPDDRFASATEFRDALFGMSWAREIVSALSNHPGPPSAPPRSSASLGIGQVRRGQSGLPDLGESDATETNEPGTQVFFLVKRVQRG